MKVIITVFLLFAFVGCKSQNENSNKSDIDNNRSTHEAEAKDQSKKNNVIYSDNFKIKLDNEIVVGEGLNESFINPQFSGDGNKLFFTNNNYSQIWVYDIVKKEQVQISSLPGSGYKFAVSNNGLNVYSRFSKIRAADRKKVNSIIEQVIGGNTQNIIFRGKQNLSYPVCLKDNLFFTHKDSVKVYNLTSKSFLSKSDLPFLYLSENKLYKYKYGKVFNLFDNRNDFVDVKYSADSKYVICLTKNNGVEVIDTEGNFINSYKGAVTLSILPNSNLVIFNKETDNGVTISNSELFIGFLNSDRVIALQNDKNEQRFHPIWSPKENKIAFFTDNGLIKIVSFNIEKNLQ